MGGRVGTLIYGVVTYAIFFATFLYAIGFFGGFVVPKHVDTGFPGGLWSSIAINVALLGLFAVQHSVMARPAFKEWWTQFVPRQIERSTYVLLTSLILILLFWQWRPMPQEVWRIDNRTGYVLMMALSGIGWLTVLAATFMIGHFELFGLRTTYHYFIDHQPEPHEFRQPLLYRYMRHPIMTGFMIAFWATPVMTAGHLLFAVVTTAYILIAVQIEERDLVKYFGAAYRDYQYRVPMLVPWRLPRRGTD